MRHLRLALIARPWYPVPPHGYGGSELVVALLAAELRSQGHEVLLFGAEGSTLDAEVCAPAAWGADLGRTPERMRETAYAATVLRRLAAAGPVDAIHDHCGGAMLVGAQALGIAPVVHTVHGALGEPEQTCYSSLQPEVGLIAISEAQRRSAHALSWLAIVHNPVDVAALRIADPREKEPYLLCLARICPAKGQHLAVEVARRTGRRLVLAGKVEPTPEGLAYYREEVAPAIDAVSIIHVHNVAGAQKAGLLAGATALLAPLQWDEPFGLAMAEAMASGTPVLAFPRGAAPELVTPGVTGFIVEDLDAMAAAVPEASTADPRRCAEEARRRFAPERAAAEYLDACCALLDRRAVGVPRRRCTLDLVVSGKSVEVPDSGNRRVTVASRRHEWRESDVSTTARHLAQELLRRIRQPEIGAVGDLFGESVVLLLPPAVRGAVAGPTDLCGWLADLLDEETPIAALVSGDDRHAVISLYLPAASTKKGTPEPVATVLIDTDGSLITRAHLVVEEASRVRLAETASDAHEDAARARYLGRRRTDGGRSQSGV